MICYIGAAQSEKQAQNAVKKYDRWTTPDPANLADVAWDTASALLGGCKLIIGYQSGTNIFGQPMRVPTYQSQYWMMLLWPAPDDALYADVVGAAAPIIEFDLSRTPTMIVPSAFVRRSANLPANLVPIDTKLLGISPLPAGTPDMGFLGDAGA